MTIGENIQKYRKSLGLSQEELGQKLHLSRQTVSLWEKDQTAPTIDNLMRLGEMFGISVDEILGMEHKESVSEMEPNETYRFIYEKTELNEIYSAQRKIIYKRPILFTLISVFLIVFSIGSSVPDLVIGFVFGMLFIGSAFHIRDIRTLRLAWKKSLDRISGSTYEYKIFGDHITVDKYRGNEKIHSSKCYFTDIERIQQLDRWLFFQFGGQSFIVRKSELKENSAFYSFMYQNPSKVTVTTVPNRWRIISVTLFVASLLSILAAIALVGAVSSVNDLFVENMWLFFLMTPIPITSTIFGFVLKAKGYKYKKNMIAGIIMTFLLCLYGSFTFMF